MIFLFWYSCLLPWGLLLQGSISYKLCLISCKPVINKSCVLQLITFYNQGTMICQEVKKVSQNLDVTVEKLAWYRVDGVSSMADRNTVVSLLWTSDFVICHCLMHQENICAKAHSEVVVIVVWKRVKLSRAQGMLCPQFKYLLSDMESEYINVLCCMTFVGWMVVGCWNTCMTWGNKLDHFWM
jgi:hypothetical protein